MRPRPHRHGLVVTHYFPGPATTRRAAPFQHHGCRAHIIATLAVVNRARGGWGKLPHVSQASSPAPAADDPPQHRRAFSLEVASWPLKWTSYISPTFRSRQIAKPSVAATGGGKISGVTPRSGSGGAGRCRLGYRSPPWRRPLPTWRLSVPMGDIWPGWSATRCRGEVPPADPGRRRGQPAGPRHHGRLWQAEDHS